MLQIDIQANGFELTPAIEAQIEKAAKKISQVDEKANLLTVYLEIQKRKDDNGCSVKYVVDRPGKNVVVQEKGDNLYDCLARIAKSTVRDVRKEKEKDQER